MQEAVNQKVPPAGRQTYLATGMMIRVGKEFGIGGL